MAAKFDNSIRIMKPILLSSDNLPFAVEDEIANHARYCIEEHLCRQLGPIKTEEPQEYIDVYRRYAPDALASYAAAFYDFPQKDCNASDGTVNVIQLRPLSANPTSFLVTREFSFAVECKRGRGSRYENRYKLYQTQKYDQHGDP